MDLIEFWNGTSRGTWRSHLLTADEAGNKDTPDIQTDHGMMERFYNHAKFFHKIHDTDLLASFFQTDIV